MTKISHKTIKMAVLSGLANTAVAIQRKAEEEQGHGSSLSDTAARAIGIGMLVVICGGFCAGQCLGRPSSSRQSASRNVSRQVSRQQLPVESGIIPEIEMPSSSTVVSQLGDSVV